MNNVLTKKPMPHVTKKKACKNISLETCENHIHNHALDSLQKDATQIRVISSACLLLEGREMDFRRLTGNAYFKRAHSTRYGKWATISVCSYGTGCSLSCIV